MTDQGPATPSATNLEGTIDATTQAVVTDTLSSLHFDKEKMRAVMNLPPTNQADNERLALAIRFILRKHFSMDFPATEMERVRQSDNAVIKFQEESRDRGLPARSVAIMLAPGQSHFEIKGVPPQDGHDAFSELFFSWKKQAGAIDQQGNIDLKRLNAFPTIQKDKPLASIYLQTQGTPGVDALGKSIKPHPGRPMKVNFNDEIITRRDDPEDPFCFQLVAARSGIIDFSLAKEDEPASLQHLDIVDTITINGDVNYKVGDLASLTDKDLAGTVNIVVKGNVLGILTLQSEGFVHVQGSIEGKKVIAKEVKAEAIGSNTSVLARE
ncbi:MAG: FapA family protein, partial [Deltaproteobacteria bacterium]